MADDDVLLRLLSETRTWAVVGWSPRPERASHEVAAFLRAHGKRVLPVNPNCVGHDVGLDAPVVATLDDITEPVDVVDVFRRSSQRGCSRRRRGPHRGESGLDAARGGRRARRRAGRSRRARRGDGPLSGHRMAPPRRLTPDDPPERKLPATCTPGRADRGQVREGRVASPVRLRRRRDPRRLPGRGERRGPRAASRAAGDRGGRDRRPRGRWPASAWRCDRRP